MEKVKKARVAEPRLRFPGFVGEWEACDLGSKTVKVGSGVTPTGGQQVYKTSGRPFVRSQNIGWGELLLDDVAFIDDETHASFFSTEVVDQDVLLNITGASIGRSAIADARIAGGNVNQHVCIIRPIEGSLDPVFLNQFLISQLGQDQIDSFQAGGNRQGLNFAQIRSLTVSLPPNFTEQQNISACLSSLDTCVGAETRKLDALKAHKQGLMQQLFPAVGEQVPRLRFPSFRGDWIAAKLGEESIVVRGGSPRPIDSYLTRAPDGINWLKIGDVDKESKFIERTEERVIPAALGKTRVIHPGDLILSNSMSFGRPYISKIVSCIHDGWLAITDIRERIVPEFLYYVLCSGTSQVYFQSLAAGSGVKNLNADTIKQLPLAFPGRAEQRKILDCFSHLDDLIAAQACKVSMLQQHKKGLMQGLFPAMGAHAV